MIHHHHCRRSRHHHHPVMMEAVCVCYPPMYLLINSCSVLINRNKVLYTQFVLHN